MRIKWEPCGCISHPHSAEEAQRLLANGRCPVPDHANSTSHQLLADEEEEPKSSTAAAEAEEEEEEEQHESKPRGSGGGKPKSRRAA